MDTLNESGDGSRPVSASKTADGPVSDGGNGGGKVAKRFSRDLIYSVCGLVVLNVVIQFVVYPYLQDYMGAETFGIVLSMLSVISIMCGAFSVGANYSRVVMSATSDDVDGDYNTFIAVICGIGVIVAILTCVIMKWTDPANIIGLVCLMVTTLVRYYSDVDFRLSLDYRGFFFYYLTISVGYIVGIVLIRLGAAHMDLVSLWWVSLILGEIAAFVFVKVKGSIYRKPCFRRSAHFKTSISSIMALSSAYLLSVIIMNADRLLLLGFATGTAVTIFYTASLLGKTVAILTGPLDGVIIGYLTKHDISVDRPAMLKITGLILVAGVILSVLTILFSYPIIGWLYPSIYEQVVPFFVIASIGQVFYFLSETLLVVVLRIAPEKYQLYINIGYAVLFFAVAVPAVIGGGIWGIAIAVLLVNITRFLFVAAFGLRRASSSAV